MILKSAFFFIREIQDIQSVPLHIGGYHKTGAHKSFFFLFGLFFIIFFFYQSTIVQD